MSRNVMRSDLTDVPREGDANHNRTCQTTTTGTTTTTAYVGDQSGADLEDVTTSGSTTTTTASYYLGGKRIALSVNHTVSYLASDLLGSAEVALNTTGSATASVLYDAYGQARYASGTMPGSYGYTGQHDDTATTGLDYYGARYYDPIIGQFASADSLGSGYNRYAYVAGNPESHTDPTGHLITCGTSCAGGGTTPSPTPPPNPPPPDPSQPTPPRPQGSPVQPAAHHTTPLDLTNPNVAGGSTCGTYNPCDIGTHRTGGLFSLIGYDTSELEVVGLAGISLLLGLLDQMVSDAATKILAIGGFTAAAVGFLFGLPLGPVATIVVGAAYYHYYQTIVGNIRHVEAYLRYVEGIIGGAQDPRSATMTVTLSEIAPKCICGVDVGDKVDQLEGIDFGTLVVGVPAWEQTPSLVPAPPQ